MNEKARITDAKSLFAELEELKKEIAEIKSHQAKPIEVTSDNDAELKEAQLKETITFIKGISQ
jgi:hypothetical protein